MAGRSEISVMISSRCSDPFPRGGDGARTLTDIRRRIKEEVEAERLFGEALFRVWINEDAPPEEGTADSWEACLRQVEEADVVLVLYNGDAGWARGDGEVGICHAEMMTALNRAPGKVRLIELEGAAATAAAGNERDRRFATYVSTQSLFRGGTVATEDEAVQRAKEALHDAVLDLASRGVRETTRGRYHSGDALSWARMSFVERQAEMVRVLADAMLRRPSSRSEDGQLWVSFGGCDVLVRPHAVPDALSVAAAKEMVGQPFLRDHEHADALAGDRAGPVHVIACHKGATVTQATKMLGFPDAIVVQAPFGIYVADDVRKVQFVFVTQCRDETSTRHGVQRLFEWLDQTGEGALLGDRAERRARIVRAIADEN